MEYLDKKRLASQELKLITSRGNNHRLSNLIWYSKPTRYTLHALSNNRIRLLFSYSVISGLSSDHLKNEINNYNCYDKRILKDGRTTVLTNYYFPYQTMSKNYY